jgi:GNAT superfamily N-acetyltransferase
MLYSVFILHTEDRAMTVQHTPLSIRPANPATDYARFAELIRQYNDLGETADTIHSYDQRMIEGDQVYRYAALLGGGKTTADEIIGYGVVHFSKNSLIPRFYLWPIIDTAHRNQGYGAALYNVLAQKAMECGATQFVSDCRDDFPPALHFARKRGFEINHHTFESALDLTAFDENVYARLITEQEAQGIRFTSLSEEGNTVEAQRKLYELNKQAALDETAHDSSTWEWSFESFQAQVINAHWFRADGQLLAVDGDRYVGLAAIGFEADGVTATNAFTGVDRAYRGRKLAQALKAVAARYAKSMGVTRILTYNDSRNVGMLAINQKMGYVRQPGFYHLLKKQLKNVQLTSFS